jgi:hypothetical protein
MDPQYVTEFWGWRTKPKWNPRHLQEDFLELPSAHALAPAIFRAVPSLRVPARERVGTSPRLTPFPNF